MPVLGMTPQHAATALPGSEFYRQRLPPAWSRQPLGHHPIPMFQGQLGGIRR
jgi:hypothetical protein